MTAHFYWDGSTYPVQTDPCPACSHTDCTCDGAPITQADVTTPAQVWDTADRPRERP